MSALIDLRAEASAGAPLLTDLPELTAQERQAAIETWRGRMVNEHISARVFGSLLGQAMQAGVCASRLEELAAFASEELRHARQCASAVCALGGEAVAPLPPLPKVPEHADAADPMEALLRNVISVCCMSETVAVALIRAETLEIGPPTLRKVLDSILADEVGHARWGWTLLREVAQPDPQLCQRLDRYLPVAFEHLVIHELAHLPAHDGWGQSTAQIGVCSGEAARALFFDTVGQVIAPGLDDCGLAGTVAWAQVVMV
ncbi:MAG: ferritin-like domain-containing protein [Myxococcales bacterium]|nr:ferritin-like domain-containing protein [Myxococcales bacterium]